MTSRTRTAVFSFLAVTLVIIVVPAFAQVPDGVSPGVADRVAEIEGRCPTFIWSPVPGAAFHELIGYRLPGSSDVVDPSPIDLADADQVLYAKVPGSAPAWEPELAECLAPDENYVWFVRAVYREEEGEVVEASEWSYGRYFSISSMPSAGEVEEALRVLRRYTGHQVDPEGLQTERADTMRAALSRRVAVPQQVPKSVTSAKTAIKGTVSDATGETYGVVGISNSGSGAGLAAANTNGGADLVLDGSADGGDADAVFTQGGIDRRSNSDTGFFLLNSDPVGELSLNVEGTIFGDGSGLSMVNAETLDGVDSAVFATEVEAAAFVTAHAASSDHDGRYFTETELGMSGSSAVHWDNLATVPAGLDDGDDDTTYSTGEGLRLVGTEFSVMGSGYDNVLVVAKGGGDFTTIQAAIDSISDASGNNSYLVWVAPGEYFGAVVTKPHVHLQGAGRGATKVTSNTSSTTTPPDNGTVVLESDVTVRDLTVVNFGTGSRNASILVSGAVQRSRLHRVVARSAGSGFMNMAVVVTGIGTAVELDDVVTMAENATDSNYGLFVYEGASTAVDGGSFTGRGGNSAYALFAQGSLLDVDVRDAVFTAENAVLYNFGVHNAGGSSVRIEGGDITGTGGATSWGVFNVGFATRIDLTDATIMGSGGTDINHGLYFNGACTVKIHGGSLTARGGESAHGATGDSSGSVIELTDVAVRADLATLGNTGLHTYEVASVTLNGGSYHADGGVYAMGIYDGATTLVATGVTATAENGSNFSYGLHNGSGTYATLVGGSYTGRGGGVATGIHSSNAGTVLEATGITAVGENGSDGNSGVTGGFAAEVSVHGGLIIGRGGAVASGIKTTGSAAVVEARNATILGENGASSYGVNIDGGTVRLAYSQLVGGTTGAATGTLVCRDLCDQNFSVFLCPP